MMGDVGFNYNLFEQLDFSSLMSKDSKPADVIEPKETTDEVKFDYNLLSQLDYNSMTSAVEEVQMSDEQQDFIDKALNGSNILVDACIGSGKTTAIQRLCNKIPPYKSVLYLTYNMLLKVDAKKKITNDNVLVQNYHGFAYMVLKRMNIRCGITEILTVFNRLKPRLSHFDVLILDEYQDIDKEISQLLTHIKEQLPNIQIIAVGDMEQKIYDKTSLDASEFIHNFLGNHLQVDFTRCFRINAELAAKLGRIWQKEIKGMNENCSVEEMSIDEVEEYLVNCVPKDILCLGSRQGAMTMLLNDLERNYPNKFNKNTVYASIRDSDTSKSLLQNSDAAIFTTFDSSKGLERKVCIVFDYSVAYWYSRARKPNTRYEILRNIFCVAASRGKDKIIFVKDHTHQVLGERVLSRSFSEHFRFEPFSMSDMFSFKYIEDVEDCFNMLEISQRFQDDISVIQINSNDGLIDLSPCIGIYQSEMFFEKYSIISSIDFAKDMYRNRVVAGSSDKNIKDESIDKQILYLTSFETQQARYYTQVDIPFVTERQKQALKKRLSTVFTGNEDVEIPCEIRLTNTGCGEISIKGRADVIKDGTIYELKFVSELNHEHFLQLASYILSMGKDSGILWNVKDNTMYEVKIPDRLAFLNQMVKTITKGRVKSFQLVDK